MLKEKHQMILEALQAVSGEHLSLRQIIRKIEENESTYLDFRTVVKCIDTLKRLGFKIDETTERRGAKKIPVKVFTLIPNP